MMDLHALSFAGSVLALGLLVRFSAGEIVGSWGRISAALKGERL